MLKFSKPLTGLDGSSITDEKGNYVMLNKILASELAQSAKGDPLKLWDWAKKLNDGEDLKLDASDIITLKEFIKNNERLTVMPKAQLLEVFKD
jgi:hypothetical protein